ncbi:MAG: hypothetical protein LHW57_02555, partial [Candidatus Cloacimonetes bacterium]|nr:hypothetical protein [Candidatus Cloacimonadota bacterium]
AEFPPSPREVRGRSGGSEWEAAEGGDYWRKQPKNKVAQHSNAAKQLAIPHDWNHAPRRALFVIPDCEETEICFTTEKQRRQRRRKQRNGIRVIAGMKGVYVIPDFTAGLVI